MKINQLALIFLTNFVILSQVATAASTPKYYRGNLIHSTQPFVRVGGDAVVFGYKVAGCDFDSLKNAAVSLRNRTKTDRWDDLWYAFTVPSGECLMLGWYDLTSRKFGWAAVQNQPNTWKSRSNSADWSNLSNGNQAKYSFTVNGQRIDLDIFNPKNEGALTGNDILISFGF